MLQRTQCTALLVCLFAPGCEVASSGHDSGFESLAGAPGANDEPVAMGDTPRAGTGGSGGGHAGAVTVTPPAPTSSVDGQLLNVQRKAAYAEWSLSSGKPFVALGVERKRASCALDEAGAAYCWGRGAPERRQGPYQAIDGGDGFLCGLKRDASIDCWASDPKQPGGAELVPPRGSFKQISLGFLQGCAIDAQDDVVCWSDVEGAQHRNPPAG